MSTRDGSDHVVWGGSRAPPGISQACTLHQALTETEFLRSAQGDLCFCLVTFPTALQQGCRVSLPRKWEVCVCVCWCPRDLGTQAAGLCSWLVLRVWREHLCVSLCSCLLCSTDTRAAPQPGAAAGAPWDLETHRSCLLFPAGKQRVPQLIEHCPWAFGVASFAHSISASLHTSSPRCPSRCPAQSSAALQAPVPPLPSPWGRSHLAKLWDPRDVSVNTCLHTVPLDNLASPGAMSPQLPSHRRDQAGPARVMPCSGLCCLALAGCR